MLGKGLGYGPAGLELPKEIGIALSPFIFIIPRPRQVSLQVTFYHELHLIQGTYKELVTVKKNRFSG